MVQTLTGDSFTNVRQRRFVMESKKEQLITEVVYQGNHTYVEKNPDDNMVKRRIRKKQDD